LKPQLVKKWLGKLTKLNAAEGELGGFERLATFSG
jgi:hypothetical protein